MKRKLFLFIETTYINSLSRDTLFVSPCLLNIGFLNIDDYSIFNRWLNTNKHLFKIPKAYQNIKRGKFCFKKRSINFKNWLKLPLGSEYYLLKYLKPISIESIKALNNFLCKEEFERYEIRFSIRFNEKILESVSEGEIEFREEY